jgi:hypothetical protein
MTTLATTRYVKSAMKQRRRLLQQDHIDYRHLMMTNVLKLNRSSIMATKQRG